MVFFLLCTVVTPCTVKRCYPSVNLVGHACQQLQCYSESPFSPVNVLLVLVTVDYLSDTVLINDSHSDPTYWVTRWSYLLLLSILLWNVHLSTQYDSKELKWNLTWAMIVYFSSEIHTLNSSMIAIFLGYMCNCSRHTNFYHFSCIYVTFHSKKRISEEKRETAVCLNADIV